MEGKGKRRLLRKGEDRFLPFLLMHGGKRAIKEELCS
jgi:hypothetical protein